MPGSQDYTFFNKCKLTTKNAYAFNFVIKLYFFQQIPIYRRKTFEIMKNKMKFMKNIKFIYFFIKFKSYASVFIGKINEIQYTHFN